MKGVTSGDQGMLMGLFKKKEEVLAGVALLTLAMALSNKPGGIESERAMDKVVALHSW